MAVSFHRGLDKYGGRPPDIPRPPNGKYFSRGTLTTRSQKGNIAHPYVASHEHDSRRETAETNANLEVTRFAYSDAGDLRALTDGLRLSSLSNAK
jgi:hypothetical protein